MMLARDAILNDVRKALNRTAQQPSAAIPDSVHVRSRVAGSVEEELDQLLSMIRELGGKTQRLTAPWDMESALGALVKEEHIVKAMAWETEDLRNLRLVESLERLGVALVPATAGKREMAECDLGITGVNAALAVSGTLFLVSRSDQPAITSLLPRIHLAIMYPEALRVDLSELFSELGQQKQFVGVSGPSRTTDIEKVLALGVHGPKELHVWCLG